MNLFNKKLTGIGLVITVLAILTVIALVTASIYRDKAENLPARVVLPVGTEEKKTTIYPYYSGYSYVLNEAALTETGTDLGTVNVQTPTTGYTEYTGQYSFEAIDESVSNPLLYSDEVSNIIPAATPNTTPPALTGVTINGNIMTLSFSKSLHTSAVPSTSMFTVKFGSTNVAVSSVAIADTRAILTLGSSATSNTVATVTYTPGGGLRIQDFLGNMTLGFTQTAVNTTPAVTTVVPATDTTAPVLSSIRISDNLLSLNYNETLDQNSVPASSAYTLRMSSGSSVNVTRVRISGSSVILTLNSTPGAGSMTIKYAVPTTNPVQDTVGNDAANISNQSISISSAASTNAPSNTYPRNTTPTNPIKPPQPSPTPESDDPSLSIDTSRMTQTQLQELLRALQVRLNALIAARASGGTTRPTGSPSAASSNTSSGYTRTLRMGDSGSDVSRLQQHLIKKGYLVIPATTNRGNFGRLTQSALIQFQLENNISPAAGVFGPITRTYITNNP